MKKQKLSVGADASVCPKHQRNTQQGITLIALIITIIVFLILAGVSIRLVINNGILGKSEKAVKAYSESETEEKVKLAYSDYKISKASQENYTFEEALKDAGLNVKIISGSEHNGYEMQIELSNGEIRTYNIEADGNVYITDTWKDNENGTYTKGDVTIKIGDKVNYNEGTGYTTKITNCGDRNYNKDIESEDLEWRVLGISNRGNIELVSTTSTTKSVVLKGYTGYDNEINILNTICQNLYANGKGALSGRSLNVDDINKLAGIVTDEQKKSLSPNYGKLWKYSNNGGEWLQYCNSTDNGQTWSEWVDIEDEDYQRRGWPSTAPKNSDGSYMVSRYGYSIANYINIETRDGKQMADIISSCCEDGMRWPQYFLASLCISNSSTDYTDFYTFVVENGQVSTSLLATTEDPDWHVFGFVRPVISLKSNVNLVENDETGWNIE